MAISRGSTGKSSPPQPGCGFINLPFLVLPASFFLASAWAGWQAGGWGNLLIGVLIGLLAVVVAYLAVFAAVALTSKLLVLTNPKIVADGVADTSKEPNAKSEEPYLAQGRSRIPACLIVLVVWAGLIAASLTLFGEIEVPWKRVAFAVMFSTGLILVFGERWLPTVLQVNRRRPAASEKANLGLHSGRRRPIHRPKGDGDAA